MDITLTSTASGLSATLSLADPEGYSKCSFSGVGAFELEGKLSRGYGATGHILNLDHTTLWDVLHAASDAGFTYPPVPGLKAPSYPTGVQT